MRILKVLLLVFLSTGVFAKGTPLKQYALGLNINTNSYFIGGVDFMIRTLQPSKKFNKLILIEAVNVKHPNEVRVSTGFNASVNPLGNKPFIFGKSNYLFGLRGQTGIDKLLFAKDERQGVRVGLSMLAGISLGFVEPYYIRYQYSSEVTRTEPYDRNIHTNWNNIMGGAGPLRGIGGTKIVPGINGRLALNFEYGNSRKYSSIIETGFLFEVFGRSIEIIQGAETQQLFTSAFISLYIGRN